MIGRIAPRPSRRLLLRALYSLILVVVVLSIGTAGIHYIEGWGYIDSFYFMSMLVTAEGPPNAPATDAGKIFASLMAFIGVGSVVTASVYLFGPALGALWRKGVEEFEREISAAEREIQRKRRDEA